VAYCGWYGKTLRVNLKSRAVFEEQIGQDILTGWLGGRGLGACIVDAEVPARCDALGPENKLVFASGPLTGMNIPGVSRFSASAKSPLTGTLIDSNAGGTWGLMLKRSGYDALIVEGESSEPVYLKIDDGHAEICPAGDLWGKDTKQSSVMIQKSLGRGSSVASIGPAGENLVKYASIIIDGSHALGRGGLGAVMGAKKLKAVAVRGSKKVKAADPEKLEFYVYEAVKWLKANPITSQGLPEFGTAVLVNLFNEMGVFPARNFQSSQFPGARGISGEAISETLTPMRRGCYRCPVKCKRLVKSKDGITRGPEYESVWALGPQCGIGSLDVIVAANNLCNLMGIDTISTGVTIGCAMELEEKGLFQTGLRFGDEEGLLRVIAQIAYREGTGSLMAEGSRYLAEKCGAPSLAMQVKGLELPAYDPRGLQGMGLSFATSNRGGCHMRAYMAGPEALGVPKMVDRFSTGGKAGLVITQQNINAALDSLIVCRFINLAVTEEYFARIFSAATGFECQSQDLHHIGERIWNLERLYNLRAGLDSSFDTLPPRLLKEPVLHGPSRGVVVDLDPMMSEYYRFRGWSANGLPSSSKLKELSLEDALC